MYWRDADEEIVVTCLFVLIQKCTERVPGIVFTESTVELVVFRDHFKINRKVASQDRLPLIGCSDWLVTLKTGFTVCHAVYKELALYTRYTSFGGS